MKKTLIILVCISFGFLIVPDLVFAEEYSLRDIGKDIGNLINAGLDANLSIIFKIFWGAVVLFIVIPLLLVVLANVFSFLLGILIWIKELFTK